MERFIKIAYTTLAVIVVFLVITDPGIISFRAHIGLGRDQVHISRKYDFYVCAIFEARFDEGMSMEHTQKYLGIAGNFIEL